MVVVKQEDGIGNGGLCGEVRSMHNILALPALLPAMVGAGLQHAVA